MPLATAGVELPKHLRIDEVSVLPILGGERGNVEVRRFWRCNRYTPPVICNATLRDGNWKLIRPAIHEAMRTPGIHWLPVSMYKPECFITDAIIHNPKSPRVVPPPPRPELSSNAMDPLE